MAILLYSGCMKISIILPTYNEKDNIGELIWEINSVFKNSPDLEIIVIDDDSPDGTAELVKDIAKDQENINLIVRTDERGLATALKTGIENSSGDVIIIMDTDFSHPPGTIPNLVENIELADIVVASRYIKGGSMIAPMYKYRLSRLMNWVIKIILGLGINDSTGGFLAVNRNVFDKIDMSKVFSGYGYGDYCFKLFFELKGENVKIKEIPFTYGIRRAGKSKTNLIKVGVNYIQEALKMCLRAR